METATKAGRYEILGELGRGATGVVYRAKDPLIGRIVATKTILLSEEGTGMSRAQLVELFQTEARAAGLLTHPNIVVIYDVGESDGVYYITMELLKGKSLQAMLESGEKFPLMRLLRITEQICSALQYAHHHGIVHRDVKPANIMLTSDDLVKVTDFGTAKILESGASQQGSTMGTPSYMSPEQIKGKAVDGRTDVFSLGVMLYEITTGQKPFRGQDVASVLHQILKEEPVPPHQVNPAIPPGVSSCIMKALTKSPHLRYENCSELIEDLKHYRPGTVQSEGSAERASPGTLAPKFPPLEKPAKSYHIAAKPATASPNAEVSDDVRSEKEHQASNVYAGPAPKMDPAVMKRVAAIVAGALLVILFGSFVMKKRTKQTDFETAPDETSTTAPAPRVEAAVDRPPYVTESNPEVAAISEMAKPWSSKKFFFRNAALSRDVPAILIRLPSPAVESKSYWAFSLEAPFAQCEFEYVEDMAKLSAEYGFEARHPMVASPCSRAVFDPLQFKELPGNILARGAIVRGYDLRPPLSIELKIKGNKINALAME